MHRENVLIHVSLGCSWILSIYTWHCDHSGITPSQKRSLDCSKLKECADNTFKYDENGRSSPNGYKTLRKKEKLEIVSPHFFLIMHMSASCSTEQISVRKNEDNNNTKTKDKRLYQQKQQQQTTTIIIIIKLKRRNISWAQLFRLKKHTHTLKQDENER